MGKKRNSGDKHTGQSIRDAGIYAASATGKSQSEIADDFGLDRRRVNQILNSDEAKRLCQVARSSLIDLQMKAVETLQAAMDNYIDDMPSAVRAATTVLKGTGALTEKVEVGLTKPFIIKLLDGGEIQMGHQTEEADDE